MTRKIEIAILIALLVFGIFFAGASRDYFGKKIDEDYEFALQEIARFRLKNEKRCRTHFHVRWGVDGIFQARVIQAAHAKACREIENE